MLQQAPGTNSNPSSLPRHRCFPSLGVCAVILVGICATAYQCRYLVFPKRFGVVVQGEIYRSGQLSRFLVESTLQKHKIRQIVDLTGFGDAEPDHRAEVEAAKRLGIAHYSFHLRGDGTGNIENYAAALEIICKARQAGEPVLVHCAAGSQRTGGTIAAYRLLFEHWSRAEVLQELQDYDWDRSQDQVLVRYLDDHWEELAASLVRRGILPKIPEKLPHLSDNRLPGPSIASTQAH